MHGCEAVLVPPSERRLCLATALGLLLLGACIAGDSEGDWRRATDAGAPSSGDANPIVILMIGDGMGAGQLDIASRYRHGEPGALAMQSLPHQGKLRTGNLSGITDSAAAATTMATGALTFNGNIGIDRGEAPLQTLVEVAQVRGMASGIVSTAYLPHATPASFTAHHSTRHEPIDIAADQASQSGADIMLGGGRRFFLPEGDGSERTDEGLLLDMQSEGYEIVSTAAELGALAPGEHNKVLGLFADEHMSYVRDRAQDTEEPTLTEMSLRALELLEAQDSGFFLMIEGARIDMASHENDLQRTIDETLAFDDAIRAVHEWAEGRANVTIIVTADHECGGLELVQPAAVETLPEVTWRWGLHTNTLVDVFASGPKSETFDGEIRDHRWVHASLLAALSQNEVAAPERTLVPDGNLEEMRYRVAEQAVETGFGTDINQLDALFVDADPHGLALGIDGAFEWDENTLLLFIDTDFGAGTGLTESTSLSDHDGSVDNIVSTLDLSGPAPEGFGAEFVLASRGGVDPHREDRWDAAGLRGIVSPHGASHDFSWHGAAINFGQEVRRAEATRAPNEGEGFEAFIEWSALYPELGGSIPRGARLGISAVLVNTDGSFVSNQALPAFAPGSENVGSAALALPGAIAFSLDADGNGQVDAAFSAGVVVR